MKAMTTTTTTRSKAKALGIERASGFAIIATFKRGVLGKVCMTWDTGCWWVLRLQLPSLTGVALPWHRRIVTRWQSYFLKCLSECVGIKRTCVIIKY